MYPFSGMAVFPTVTVYGNLVAVGASALTEIDGDTRPVTPAVCESTCRAGTPNEWGGLSCSARAATTGGNSTSGATCPGIGASVDKAKCCSSDSRPGRDARRGRRTDEAWTWLMCGISNLKPSSDPAQTTTMA